MGNVEVCTEKLLDSIRSDKAYIEYQEYEEILGRDSKLKERIDLFRKTRFEAYQHENWYDEIEDVDNQFADLVKMPEVNSYLQAETELCRLVQKIQAKMIGGLNISIPEL